MIQDFKKKLDLLQTKQIETSVFWNLALDKGTLKSFISWFLENYGEKKTLQILEELKNLGFGYATKAGISLGIEDLKIPPKKIELLANSERIFTEAQFSYRRGEITGIEKMQLFIETWTETSETLKDEVVSHFEKTDVLNPVYMMAFSGARGNMSQVRQLVGMRGLMSDPQGKIIDFPIQSNFREGLTLTEYLISTYGARKGIVDTALRTATAGYLTRRLVDVAQHVVVSKFDCETKRGIFLFDMKEGIKNIYSFQNRLMGRVLAQDIFFKTEKLAFRNQEMNSVLASKISKITKKALVRSPLTCQTRKFVCQLCYGWSLSNSKLVAIGEAVGVIAGQSIGEPGTQLTMRTFHTGGVFSSTVTEQINAPFEAFIEYAEPIAGTCVRTPQGNFAFLTKTSGTLFCKKSQKDMSLNFMNTYKIPAFTLLFARHGQFVKKDELLAQVSAFPLSQKTTQTIEQTIYSSLEGEVYYTQLNLLDDIEEKYGERTSKSENWSRVWVLSAKILKDSLNSKFFPYSGDYVSKNSVMNQIEWVVPPSQSVQIHLKNSTVQPPKFHISTDFVQNQSFSIHKLKKNFLINQNSPFSKVFFGQHKVKKTDIKYPYQHTARLYLTKILTQTSLKLPLLNPGVLKIWLKRNQKKTSRSRLNAFEIVKKLNLTKKFEQHSTRNFFYPLILANSIPFSLKSKSLQNYLQLKKLGCSDFSFNLQSKRKTITKLDQKNFAKKIDKKIHNFPKLKFSNSSIKSAASAPIKFDQLSVTNSILTFKTYKTTYKRLGYFSQIFMENGLNEKLFSFFPLNLNSNGQLKTFGLENTDQWNPNPMIGFHWFPTFSRLKSSGLFLLNSSYFFYKNFHEKMEDNSFKNPKIHLTYMKKYGKFLNLSQSQIIKNYTSSSKLRYLQNFKPLSSRNSSKYSKELGKNFDLNKFVSLKETNLNFESLQTLIIKVDPFEKFSVSFNQVEFIPQENYHFKTTQLLKMSKSFDHPFYFLKNSKHIHKKFANFYLTNAQGFQKEFHACQEGFIFLKALKKNPSLINNVKKFKNPFLVNFHDSKEKTEFSNVEFLLKSNFLKYIKNKHIFKVFKNTVKINPSTNKNFLYTIQKSYLPRFSFIPFSKNKNSTNETLAMESQEFQMNIKPGWIYKSTNVSKVLNFHKRIIESGTCIVDNICFSQEKVFTEIIQMKNHFFNMEGLNFKTGSTLKNRKARFLNGSVETSQERKNSFYLLIRPVQSQIHPNLQTSKKILYKSVQQVNKSYFLYNQYFSHNFNQQKKLLKTLSNFAPLDIKVESKDLFSFSNKLYHIQKDKTPKFKSKLNKDLLLKQKNLKISFFLLKLLLSHSMKNENKQSTIYKPIQIKSKNLKHRSYFNILYFSNYPTNFFKLSISLNVSNPKFFDFSFSKIFFNLTSSNVYLFKNFSKQIYQKLKLNYLNLLILRNQSDSLFSNFKTFSKNNQCFKVKEQRNLNNQCFKVKEQRNLNNQPFKVKEQLIKYPLKHPVLNEKKIQYYLALTAFSPNCFALPRFEYVFDQTYGFLGNQKLFATSFYKQQFDMSLNLNIFENLGLNFKNNKNKQFLQKQFKARSFYRSYYSLPRSKNLFIFKNQLVNLKPSFNLTNFYSSFEGEILKDYLKEPNLQNLKKSLNINTEDALLSESQAEKLILTKSDLFGLTFPSEKKKTNFVSLSPPTSLTSAFFTNQTTKKMFEFIFQSHQTFRLLETNYFATMNSNDYTIPEFNTNYANKYYKVKNLSFSLGNDLTKFRLGKFINPGDNLYAKFTFLKSGQIIHLNSKKLTLRKAEFFAISPKAILHTYNGQSITKNAPVMTLPFETLKTGDIVQGIPKVEQYLEARTTIQGRLFLNSLPVLLHAIYYRYSQKLSLEKAVRQSFLKIQQILVDGVQRVYRSQGVSIADKHLEIIVRQMTSKVKIVYGGQTGFFAGELVDLEFVERINQFLMVKIQYEPVVLGITRSSLEVDSFLSAASFQQTTKVLTKAALENKKDFLKGLKENLLVGNLLPAGTGYVIPLS